jgi:uncharacterized LabA/DUF88 family protein
MVKKERVIILIDGSNFYNRRRECNVRAHRLTKFSYLDFASHLANGRQVLARNYYIGVIKAHRNNVKGQELRKKQQQLFSHLTSKSQKFNIILGENRKSGTDYHEKGVDVRMAVDIVAGAYEDYYDTAIVVSSDSDLIPAINHARKRGKKIEYIGFIHKPTNDLINKTDAHVLLSKTDVEQFIS